MNEENIKITFKELKEKFLIIKNKGFIKGIKQKSLGSPGLTFENLVGKENDELPLADYEGVEIKVKNKKRSSYRYITLFSLVPSNCFGIKLKELRENYGIPDSIFTNVKVLMSPVYTNHIIIIFLNCILNIMKKNYIFLYMIIKTI